MLGGNFPKEKITGGEVTTYSFFFQIMDEKTISRELAEIKAFSLLAAKSVLTLDDVALLTGLSKSHLYKLTSSKEIPHYRPNGKFIYFSKDEIEKWMMRGRVASNDEIQRKAVNYTVTGKGGAR